MIPNPLMPLGDTIPSCGNVRFTSADFARDSAAARTMVVRSSMNSGNEPEFALDIGAIERDARAAQSAWIASAARSYFEALVRAFSRPARGEKDERPASAQSLERLADRAPTETAPLPRPAAHTF